MTWTTTLLRWTARVLWTSVEAAVDWDDLDVGDHVGQERLADAVDWDAVDPYEHGLDPDRHLAGPAERLHQLPDEHDRIYVWKCDTPEAEQQLSRIIGDEYRREYGREPEAAHVVVSDLEELRSLEPDQLQAWVAPGDGA